VFEVTAGITEETEHTFIVQEGTAELVPALNTNYEKSSNLYTESETTDSNNTFTISIPDNYFDAQTVHLYPFEEANLLVDLESNSLQFPTSLGEEFNVVVDYDQWEEGDAIIGSENAVTLQTEQAESSNINYLELGDGFDLDSYITSGVAAAPLTEVENCSDNEDVTMAESNKDDDCVEKKTVKKKTVRRHVKGPIQQPLESLPEENRANVLRCRVYRENKNIKLAAQLDELQTLEAKNARLKEKEQKMKDTLVKLQTKYLKLISGGNIKLA